MNDHHEAALLQESLLRMSLTDVKSYFRENLQRLGTNVDQNDADPLGDGDQSRVKREDQQFYRDMFAAGGDINHLAEVGLHPLSDFAKHCISGQVEQVKQELERIAGKGIENTAEPSPELIKLLETRETAMRLSPLMMIVSIGKNLQGPNSHGHVEVAKLLLKYGARPDAQDVCGKTVCHYGMGAMATKMTIKVVRLCMEAHSSSHLFGKKIELHNLKTASMNGQQGWCKGYVTDTGRRAIYLVEAKETVGIKPANLRLVEDAEMTPTPTKLCDIPDRLGAVCLLEVIQADRQDVARVLLSEFQPNLDIEDCDGMSPRGLSIRTAMMSSVAAMVNKAAAKDSKKEQKKRRCVCSNCGKAETEDLFFQCSICKTVQYCGKNCQKQHWKKGHKNVCAGLAEQQSLAIVLEKPKGERFVSVVSLSSLKNRHSRTNQKESTGYTKPSNVTVDEKFAVKVQGGGPMTPLMLYDKSREFSIDVAPGSPGFQELLKAVKAEPTWQGRKTFVSASFDADGNCIVYPGLTSIHKW